MNIYSNLLDDDTQETMKVPADIIQFIDEKRSDAKMSREDFIRAALRNYTTYGHDPKPLVNQHA